MQRELGVAWDVVGAVGRVIADLGAPNEFDPDTTGARSRGRRDRRPRSG